MEFPFERAAMTGKESPPDLDIADLCAFYALKNLYCMYNKGNITRDAAKLEKKHIVRAWTRPKSQLEFLERSALEKNCEILGASNAFEKEQTVENARAMFKAMFNREPRKEG